MSIRRIDGFSCITDEPRSYVCLQPHANFHTLYLSIICALALLKYPCCRLDILEE